MKRTDKTLLEQMKISDLEISRRRQLLNLNAKSLNQLLKCKPAIEDNIDAIVDEFYETQTAIDEIALLIGDSDTLARLRAAQHKYILDLFSGHYDAQYVNNRLRIGMVHKRIGVSPKLYLSAVMEIKKILMKTLTDTIKDKNLLGDVLGTLDRLLYFDTTLVFDTYIDSLVGEIESGKERLETYATSLEEKIAERTQQLEEQAKLDPLTGIYNQRAMQDVLRRELAVAKRRQTVLSLVYFDVDKFKDINDKYGHLKGDEVLKSVGLALINSIREVDIPCRYGGDEFCLILPECGIDNAKTICEKLIASFTSKHPDFSFSLGIAETGPTEFVDEERLIKMADDKMYLAKKEKGFQIRT